MRLLADKDGWVALGGRSRSYRTRWGNHPHYVSLLSEFEIGLTDSRGGSGDRAEEWQLLPFFLLNPIEIVIVEIRKRQ